MRVDDIKAWQKVFRDLVIVALAVFLFVHEAVVAARSPNLYLIAAGLTLLGLPPALRLDEWRTKNGQEKEAQEDDAFEDAGGYYKRKRPGG